MRNVLPEFFILFGYLLFAQARNGLDGTVIQEYLRWNYTYMNENCTSDTGRNPCQDIRICNFAVASLALGGWPTLCGWVANTVPKVCCGLPLVLGKTLMEKVEEEIARKRECGTRTYSPDLSETRTKFFEILQTIPEVDISNPEKFDPPLDLSVETMTSSTSSTNSRQGNFPWMVSIRENGTHLCGGSLIDRSHIVTAAHCFNPDMLEPEMYSVRIGNLKADEGYPVGVRDIILHEGYEPKQFYNDIAILTLEKEILSRFVAQICLPPPPRIAEMNLLGQNTTFLGWGEFSSGGRGTSVLHIVDNIPVLPSEECRTAYGTVSKLAVSQDNEVFICAGLPEDKKYACQTDNGGVLMYKDNAMNLPDYDTRIPWVLVGIQSFGHGCGAPGYPEVYTRVSSYMDWILRQVNE